MAGHIGEPIHVDVAIIGAGTPAGATLARLIGNSRKVLLIERRDLLEQKEKNTITNYAGLIALMLNICWESSGLEFPVRYWPDPSCLSISDV